MKKVLAIIISVLILLLSACTNVKNTPKETQEETEVTSTTTIEAHRGAPPKMIKKGSIEEGSFSFGVAFPDLMLARRVASLFEKNINDMTTLEELASYTGALNLGPPASYDEETYEPLEGLSLEGIGYLTGLTSFSCYKNWISEIPAEIGNLVNLKELDLCKSFYIKTLPPEIEKLKKLEYLSTAVSGFESIPKEIGELQNLKYLNLGACSISELPEKIGNLKNLVGLDVHSTNIAKLPDSICNLTNLEHLDIGQLNLKELPEKIGNLTKLKYLDIFGSDLKTLPKSIKNLKKLEYLNVYDNYNLDESYKKYFKEEVWRCGVVPGMTTEYE